MNAIAVVQALRSRADIPDVTHDPHLMLGLLLLNERGISERTLGQAIGYSAAKVRGFMGQARVGGLRRATPWMGEKHSFSMGGSAPAPAVRRKKDPKRREVFTTLWYRDAIGLMLKAQGMMTGNLDQIALRHELGSAEADLIWRLKGVLQREGFEVAVQPDAVGRRARYTLEGQHAERMRQIIGNGWFEVSR
jgi:hypothetical protein